MRIVIKDYLAKWVIVKVNGVDVSDRCTLADEKGFAMVYETVKVDKRHDGIVVKSHSEEIVKLRGKVEIELNPKLKLPKKAKEDFRKQREYESQA